MKRVLFFMLIIMSFISINAADIEAVTEKYPPFQWYDEGAITGPSADVIEAMLKKTGLKYTNNMYPWARAYHIALNAQNVLIYSITRSTKRENLFKWIGPIASHNVYFWKLKSRKDIVVDSLEGAKRYRIGGVNKDAKTQYFFNNGFIKDKHIFTVHSTDVAIKLLYANRTDLLIENESLSLQVEKLGFDYEELEKVYHVKGFSQELYAAFSLMTSDEIVEEFRHVLHELKKNGEFKKIMNKYE